MHVHWYIRLDAASMRGKSHPHTVAFGRDHTWIAARDSHLTGSAEDGVEDAASVYLSETRNSS